MVGSYTTHKAHSSYGLHGLLVTCRTQYSKYTVLHTRSTQYTVRSTQYYTHVFSVVHAVPHCSYCASHCASHCALLSPSFARPSQSCTTRPPPPPPPASPTAASSRTCERKERARSGNIHLRQGAGRFRECRRTCARPHTCSAAHALGCTIAPN